MQKRVAVMAGARVSAEVDNRVGNSALEPCVSLPLYQLLSGERRIFVTQHILHRDFMLLRQERLVRKFHQVVEQRGYTRDDRARRALLRSGCGLGTRAAAVVRVHELREVVDQALGRYGRGNDFLRRRDGVCARWCRRVGHGGDGGAAVFQEERVHEPAEPQSHLATVLVQSQ